MNFGPSTKALVPRFQLVRSCPIPSLSCEGKAVTEEIAKGSRTLPRVPYVSHRFTFYPQPNGKHSRN